MGVPLKIESNEIVLSYGRDLSLLSQYRYNDSFTHIDLNLLDVYQERLLGK